MQAMEEKKLQLESDMNLYARDFVKLAESYGAHGIRVTSEEEIAPALKQARANTDALTIIEFLISCGDNSDDNVFNLSNISYFISSFSVVRFINNNVDDSKIKSNCSF